MGAKFVELDLEALEGTGGYAREMTEERAAKQRELLTPYIAAADAVITTAAVPGRPAPLLVTREMVEAMRPGSVVVDLAAESGGNVEGSVAGRTRGRARRRRPSGDEGRRQCDAGAASQLYARNVVNLLLLMTKDGNVVPDFDDEIVAATCVTHDGRTARRLLRAKRHRGNDAVLTIFVLAVFVGFEVVSKVSTTLHTPLMSGANAIHGVILVGAIAGDRSRGRHRDARPGAGLGRAGDGQPGRRLRRHRPDAGDVRARTRPKPASHRNNAEDQAVNWQRGPPRSPTW